MDIRGMMQQAANMQKEFKRIQEEAATKTVEATAGGGMIKVVATGKQTIKSIEIDPEVLKLNDVHMLQDLVVAGVNEALKASQKLVSDDMGKLTESLGPLGAMFK